MKPEPEPVVPPPKMSPPLELWMVTTDGATLLTAVITALDSLIARSWTVVASEPVVCGTSAVGSAMRFATPTAERAPERMPATTAIATTATAPIPRGPRAGRGGSGGRLVHVCASSGAARYGARLGTGP